MREHSKVIATLSVTVMNSVRGGVQAAILTSVGNANLCVSFKVSSVAANVRGHQLTSNYAHASEVSRKKSARKVG